MAFCRWRFAAWWRWWIYSWELLDRFAEGIVPLLGRYDSLEVARVLGPQWRRPLTSIFDGGRERLILLPFFLEENEKLQGNASKATTLRKSNRRVLAA